VARKWQKFLMGNPSCELCKNVFHVSDFKFSKLKYILLKRSMQSALAAIRMYIQGQNLLR